MNGIESRDWSGWVVIGLAVVLLVGVFALFAAVMPPIGGSYGMMGGGTWGWGILVMIIPALVLLVILVVVLAAPRGPTPAAFWPVYVPSGPNAVDALEQRYARGELSREEYLRIRGDLTLGSSQS